MNFQELIRFRESVRSYDPDRKVAENTLKRILEAGRLAPSAANRQPWIFYLVSSGEALAKVHRCYGKSWFREAPHVLVVAGKRDNAWTRQYDGYNSLETDLTIAMDHMILAAAAEGVGTCWIAAYDPDKLRSTGILQEDETVFALTPLGYPEEGYSWGREKTRKPLDNIVRFI